MSDLSIVEVELIEGGKIYLPTQDFISDSIRSSRMYFENDIIRQLDDLEYPIEGNWSVIDIGANIGIYGHYFNRKGLFVHSFEPNKLLRPFIELNVPNGECHQIALGNENGTINLINISNDNQGRNRTCHTIPNDNVEYDVVSLKRLDDINIDSKVFLIKIDVEGYEEQVWNGMKETLKKHKPYIIIEYHFDIISPSFKSNIESELILIKQLSDYNFLYKCP